MRKHPDREAVLAAIEGFLGQRVFRGWRVDGLRFDFQTSSYDLICSNGQVTVSVKLLSEWIDKARDGNDSFSRRPIKRALKEAFKIHDDEFDADA